MGGVRSINSSETIYDVVVQGGVLVHQTKDTTCYLLLQLEGLEVVDEDDLNEICNMMRRNLQQNIHVPHKKSE
jgi:hypothetical protein